MHTINLETNNRRQETTSENIVMSTMQRPQFKTNINPTLVTFRVPANSCSDGGEEFTSVGLVLWVGISVLEQHCY